MEMTMRWYGKEYDTVTLQQIRQSCYVKGIISTLYNKMPGEVWELDEILALKKDVEDAGLFLAGIESVNVSDAIKTGGPDRDKDIEAYIKTLENLGKADIHMVCYNFMPVFDWTRTELDRMREDGTTVLAYNQDVIDSMDPEKMFDAIKNDMNGTVMPGWEPERMEKVKELNDNVFETIGKEWMLVCAGNKDHFNCDCGFLRWLICPFLCRVCFSHPFNWRTSKLSTPN